MEFIRVVLSRLASIGVDFSICSAGLDPGVHRNLCGDGLRGDAADSGDRSQDGVGCATRGCAQDNSWVGSAHHAAGCCDWIGGNACCKPASEQPAVSSKRNEPADLFQCAGAANDGRDACGLHPSPPRSFGRSDACVESGIGDLDGLCAHVDKATRFSLSRTKP
jgi:hypothetical protein